MADIVRVKKRKTPNDRILDLENRLGVPYTALSKKYDESYNTIYGRIYRRRKKQENE